jgi:hypothetical protein
VIFARNRRIGQVGSGPAVRAGIISAAGIQCITIAAGVIAAPNNHLRAGPYSREIDSPSGRAAAHRRAGGTPSVISATARKLRD